MPTYDYECSGCKHVFELLQSMSEKPKTLCPKCKKKKLKRLIGAGMGIIFKGTGFYETDYKRKSVNASGGRTADSSSSEKDKKTEVKSSSQNSSGESATPPSAVKPEKKE